MQAVKKVEIIISTVELNEVLDILNSVMVSGYTVIENIAGKGDRGMSYNDLGRESSNSYIMTVCTNEKQLTFLVEGITDLLKRIGGVCLVTDSNWVLH
ncbi:P-II family nitrogen regulator [Crocosphaera sp. XPORK-15E]|uniref:P-II family nitrogen regulator n=1 Tax=Crocosphaera sp. XPORK-15E TaxID=3110247 RepID=UPI002B1FA319|nr:transcriptional regulator [Crocosphaera sp. XPORK-15E]MEA5534743.1 transcriptional regulator [Crocosphaera sp. XPORK-15E]